MRKGLVLGKFMPLHNGHLSLINFALKHCDTLIVWLCVAHHEQIPASVRLQWLNTCLANEQRIHIQLYEYQEEGAVSSSSVASWDISKAWAKIIREEIGEFDVLISSEPYGDYLSELLFVQHIPFDVERTQVAISATAIRQNPYLHWQHLPQPVRKWYSRTVCILGTESTGKTELSKRLCAYFGGAFVSEAGRDLVENSEQFDFSILGEIATKHAQAILETKSQNLPFVFVDTDIHITKSYAQFVFQQEIIVEKWIMEANRADLYLYLEADAPFVQDGTRMNEADRNRLNLSHKQILAEHNITYHTIKGTWQERFEIATKIIESVFCMKEK